MRDVWNRSEYLIYIRKPIPEGSPNKSEEAENEKVIHHIKEPACSSQVCRAIILSVTKAAIDAITAIAAIDTFIAIQAILATIALGAFGTIPASTIS